MHAGLKLIERVSIRSSRPLISIVALSVLVACGGDTTSSTIVPPATGSGTGGGNTTTPPSASTGTDYTISSEADFTTLPETLSAGDKIFISNGTYSDVDFIFKGEGTPEDPIELMASTPGGAIFTGASSIDMEGSYLTIKGLTFKDGTLVSGASVIEFRNERTQARANNSRVTDIVIDNYGPSSTASDADESRQFITLYGKNNQVDNSLFLNHMGRGVTVNVRLADDSSANGLDINNHHDISYNYFGPRPDIGGNGGEIIRIGTSAYHDNDSYTNVHHNYFERMDAEIEIISIKARRNEIYENFFDTAQGTITIRNGSHNKVYRNVFIGNDVSSTGGIRVIHTDNEVYENYLEGIRGDDTRSAISVMSGVVGQYPGGQGYERVVNASIHDNTLVDVSQLNIGHSGGYTEADGFQGPRASEFRDNLIADVNPRFDVGYIFRGPTGDPNADIENAIDIAYFGNVTNHDDAALAVSGLPSLTGVLPDGAGPIATLQSFSMTRESNGLLYPDRVTVGAPRDLVPIERNMTGPSWYNKPNF